MIQDQRLEAHEVLKHRLRCGQIKADAVKLAADIGHPAARQLFPSDDRESFAGSQFFRTRIFVRAGRRASLRFAVNCAENVLRGYETFQPGDVRPRRAFDAARAFLDGDIPLDLWGRDALRDAAGHANDAAVKTRPGYRQRSQLFHVRRDPPLPGQAEASFAAEVAEWACEIARRIIGVELGLNDFSWEHAVLWCSVAAERAGLSAQWQAQQLAEIILEGKDD